MRITIFIANKIHDVKRGGEGGVLALSKNSLDMPPLRDVLFPDKPALEDKDCRNTASTVHLKS